WKIRRSLAILIVLLSVVIIVIILGITIIPLIVEQFNQLLERLPSWLNSSSEQLNALEAWTERRNLPVNLTNLGQEFLGRISNQLQQISGQVLGSIFSVLSSAFDFLLIAVLTFYLLLHGEEVWQLLFKLLPDNIASQIRRSLGETFQNYFIGQVSVATVMGLTITMALLIMQVPFGLLFGVGVGIMAIFPFGGALSIGIISFLVALKSFWLGVQVLVVAFIIEQIVENVIAPRLLGEFTGLNPVLILISLLIGAKVAGFIGLILAVPLASFAKSATAIYQTES
ncbi:MAG TPA: AI-2E family transporter, partial [Xenococcaceae cyanobacterium]